MDEIIAINNSIRHVRKMNSRNGIFLRVLNEHMLSFLIKNILFSKIYNYTFSSMHSIYNTGSHVDWSIWNSARTCVSCICKRFLGAVWLAAWFSYDSLYNITYSFAALNYFFWVIAITQQVCYILRKMALKIGQYYNWLRVSQSDLLLVKYKNQSTEQKIRNY